MKIFLAMPQAPNENKNAGTLYEIEFQLECLKRGFPVSVPIGDNLAYDLVVDGNDGLKRVQVRGTTVLQNYSYQACTGTGQSKTVRRDAYDFLAVRIPNHDAWYVVPRKALGTRASAHFTPHNPKGKGQYEPYRDAFGLL